MYREEFTSVEAIAVGCVFWLLCTQLDLLLGQPPTWARPINRFNTLSMKIKHGTYVRLLFVNLQISLIKESNIKCTSKISCRQN